VVLLSACVGCASSARAVNGGADASLDVQVGGEVEFDACAGATGQVCESNADCAGCTYCRKWTGCAGAGQCVSQPEFWNSFFCPVCGCDGNSYENVSVLAVHGLSAAYTGPCTDAGAVPCAQSADCPGFDSGAIPAIECGALVGGGGVCVRRARPCAPQACTSALGCDGGADCVVVLINSSLTPTPCASQSDCLPGQVCFVGVNCNDAGPSQSYCGVP
jgi:hypothetical protein